MTAQPPVERDGANPALASAANHLRILGHPSRLAIVVLLLGGACAVSEIEATLGLRQPNLSQHLGLLRDANLLTSRRAAKSVIYELADGRVRDFVRVMAEAFGLDVPATARPARSAAAQGGSARRAAGSESDDASVFAQVLRRDASV